MTNEVGIEFVDGAVVVTVGGWTFIAYENEGA